MATCELITIVGAGDVVAKRLLPAITAAQLASKVNIIHDGINDVRPPSSLPVSFADLSSMGTAAAEWVRGYFGANMDPVIVATPPWARSFYLHAALKGSGLLIAEKPLYIDKVQRGDFPISPTDLKRIFALSYYTQEKAITWSWLHDASASQERALTFENGRHAEEVRELFANLGELRTVEIAICEGAAHPAHSERRFWFEAIPAGVWFDMGVHVFSLLFAVSSRVAITDVTANDELTQFIVKGVLHDGAQFRCQFGKAFAGEVERRFLVASYAEGKVICDVDSCSCIIEHDRLGHATVSARYGSQRYRTLIEQVREFILRGGWPQAENRSDTLGWQRQALDLLIEAWPSASSV